jgi:hypothetical protein
MMSQIIDWEKIVSHRTKKNHHGNTQVAGFFSPQSVVRIATLFVPLLCVLAKFERERDVSIT